MTVRSTRECPACFASDCDCDCATCTAARAEREAGERSPDDDLRLALKAAMQSHRPDIKK